MPETKKPKEETRVKCDVCEKVLEEESRFYVISLANVTQNDGKVWDYEREEDDSAYCLKCGGKVLPRI